MIHQRPHTPKTAALVAYDAGALSAPRRAQVEAHLSGCETCRTELASIRLWSRESARMRAVKTVPVDFSKMELALAREAKNETSKVKAQANSRRLVPLFAPLALAATVLLTIGFDRLLGTASHEVAPRAGRVASAAPAPLRGDEQRTAEVTLVAGEARARGASELTPGARIAEASIVDVRDGRAHLAFEAGGAQALVAVLSGTSIGLPRIDEAGAEIEVLRGSLAVRAGFSSESRVVVLAAGYRIEASTAVFDLVLSEEVPSLALEVREGELRVVGMGVDQVLTAPMRFAPPEAESSVLGESHAPPAMEPDGGVLVRVERPSAVAWEVDGLGSIEGAGILAFRMQPGPLHLVSIDGLGRRTELSREVGPEGLLVAGEPLAPTAPTLRGYLDPSVINGVVRTSLPNLQRCYEHALRMRPELGGGALVVRVTVAADGGVLRTRIDGGDVPATLQACVTDAATSWTFPAPGAPVSFDLPLRFRAR